MQQSLIRPILGYIEMSMWSKWMCDTNNKHSSLGQSTFTVKLRHLASYGTWTTMDKQESVCLKA